MVVRAGGLTFPGVGGSYDAILVAGRLDLCLVTRVAGALRLAGCLGGQYGAFSTRGDEQFPGGGMASTFP